MRCRKITNNDHPQPSPAGRVLGLDVGQRRIGVALSDELGWTAQGLTVIQRQSLEADTARIAALVREHGCQRIVIGLPRRTDGRLGPEAEAVQAFGRRLEAVAGVPVVYWDERFSTAQAEHTLIAAGVRRSRRRQVIDQVAASVILQAYLDRQRRETDT
ncbi:MAG: Holliday junction resolvase RuvX [Limnochordales bacterium]|nr:Holliday junction resolvase RuvX [Limnochordales bacterium]